MKYYKIYGNVEFIFDGNSEIHIKVTKETKDTIEGYEIGNWRGNYHKGKPMVSCKKIVLVKKNLTAWKEIDERRSK